jgi:hypothetical protein
MALQNRESNQLEASEEVADFEGGGFRAVGTVSAIVADAGAEVMANGAGSGFLGVGGAHSVTPLLDGPFYFEDHGEDLAGAHEAAEFAKEWALLMNGIKARGFALSEDHRFDGHNAEARLVDARENFALKIARYGVGLDESESAFESQATFSCL